MPFGNNPIVDRTTVENTGENAGTMIGSNSGQVNVNCGLGYNDTKALCLDITREDIAKYAQTAHIEAERRRDELFEMLMNVLANRQMADTQTLSAFCDPAMQFDYFEAQKAYMKAGTPELADILSQILAERVGESERTLLQIALGEAIQVAPKLVTTQMRTLALVFFIKHIVRYDILNHDTLTEYLENIILPIYRSGVGRKQAEFQHLNFTGCSQYAAIRSQMAVLFQRKYAGLFMSGIENDQLPKDSANTSLVELYPDLFIKCLNNDSLLQINAISTDALDSIMKEHNVTEEHQRIIRKLFHDNQMSESEVQSLIVKLVPDMQEVFDYWRNSDISVLTLSSVGVVLGAQYAQMVTGEQYDLSTWI